MSVNPDHWFGRQYGLRATGGFSLLELLVVIVIISVLLRLIMPGLSGAHGRDLADTAERLSMIINHARQEVVLSSRTWRLEINPEGNTYRFQECLLRERLGCEFIQISRKPFAETRLQPDISVNGLEIDGQVTAATGQVRFFPTGEQDAFRLTLQSGDSRRVISMGSLGPAGVRVP